MYLGIPGVDDPYPKEVQDALDFIDKETKRQERLTQYHVQRRAKAPKPPSQTDTDLVFWETRRKQQAAQQKKRPYQQVDRADQWPSW